MSEEHDNWVERNSKTITTLATASIPVVLAVFGFFAQNAINQQNLGKEYIELALSILQEPIAGSTTACITAEGESATSVPGALPDDIDDCQLTEGQALRKFAVDLINKNSEEDLTGDARTALILGRQRLNPLQNESDRVTTLVDELAIMERALLASLRDSEDFPTGCVVVILADDVVDTDGRRVEPFENQQRTAIAERVTEGDKPIRFLQLEGGETPWVRVRGDSMSLVNCDRPAPAADAGDDPAPATTESGGD